MAYHVSNESQPSVIPPWRLFMAAAVPVMLGILIVLPHWPVGLFYDDGVYLILGRSLAAGEGLRYLNLPGEFSATRYPPVYPVLLALLWRLTDSLDTAAAMARMLNGLMLATLAGFLAIVIHRITPITGYRASAIAALGVAAAPLLNITLLPMSEPTFLVLAILGLWAAEQTYRTPEDLRMAAAAGLLGGLAYLTRSAALPLIVATVVLLARRRAWKALGVYALLTLALILPWQAWVAAHETALPAPFQASYGSYGTWYATGLDGSTLQLAIATAATNLTQIPVSLGVLVTPQPMGALTSAAGVGLLLLLAAGFFRLARTWTIAAWALAGYVGLILIWPFDPARFIHTVWPLLLPVLILGIARGTPTTPRRWMTPLRRASQLLGGLLFTGYLATVILGFATRAWDLPHRTIAARLVPVLTWIDENTQATDLIATGLDPAVFLYTGRPTIPPTSWAASDYVRPVTAETQAQRLLEMLETFRPDYLIVQHRMNQLQPGLDHLMRQHPGRLALVATFEDGTRILTPAREPVIR
jgi:hypothetical protein